MTSSSPVPRRALPLLAATALLTLVAVAPTVAAADRAAVVGGDVAASRETSTCLRPDNCMIVQQLLPGRDVSAPFPGVVVRWAVRGVGAFSVAPVRYIDIDTVVVPRYPGSPQGRATSDAAPTWFAIRPGLPIDAGEHVALVLGDGAVVRGDVDVPGADADGWYPPPPLGAPTVAQIPGSRSRVAYQVVVEPDADRDRYGDETQDGCPSRADVHGACPAAPAAPAVPGTPAPTTPAPPTSTTPAPPAPDAPTPPVPGASPSPAAAPGGRRSPLHGLAVTGRGRPRLRFRLDAAARVTALVSRRTRRGGYRRMITRTLRARAGVTRIALHRRARALPRGRYRATVRVLDARRHVVAASRLRFRLPR